MPWRLGPFLQQANTLHSLIKMTKLATDLFRRWATLFPVMIPVGCAIDFQKNELENSWLQKIRGGGQSRAAI